MCLWDEFILEELQVHLRGYIRIVIPRRNRLKVTYSTTMGLLDVSGDSKGSGFSGLEFRP